jgi:hypothetical protein
MRCCLSFRRCLSVEIPMYNETNTPPVVTNTVNAVSGTKKAGAIFAK